MKFPVAPESMRAVVSTVLLFPCSKMGKLIDLLLGSATSTQLIKWEEDVETISVAHAPPAMVLFFLFLFLPLFFAFVLTAVAVLYKPGCAISAADTSSV